MSDTPFAVLRSTVPQNGRYLTITERRHLAAIGIKVPLAVIVLRDGEASHGILWRENNLFRRLGRPPVREPLNLAVTLAPSLRGGAK